MKKFLEGLLIWLVIVVLISVAYIQFSGNIGKSKTTIPFSEFLTKLEDDDIENVTIRNQSIEGKFKDGSSFHS
ncbi:MAG: ATP-dependent metallopeptidase FtsH/Yme1/Tma family protein, partial [Wolbachia pipientis]|nr:ATP-dependent metallopeptidase FtsH/Yme1/Tma family protein [Wolbachia pipientis]